MSTETLDRLYLEWSNFTKARHRREIAAAAAIWGLLHMENRKPEERQKIIEQAELTLKELRGP